ncbi:hemicentin-1-like [Montipora foliosa]|uniref:hemicentin-1-like n=1 Tax=Montipora foliosa TaxID=591990 RepID=UPI0035F1B955
MWQIPVLVPFSCLIALCNGQGPKPAPPQITEFLQNDLVAPDEVKFRDNVNWQLNLPCRATGSNKLSWEWRHNDSIINPNKFEFDDDWQLSQDGTLKAKGLSISDSGTYQCFVTDTVTGVKTFSRKLRVAVTAVGQFNDYSSITRQVQLGRPFEFDCPPHGPSSLVSFTWTSKKELNIQFPRSERVAIDPSNGALHIMYVTPEDITHIRDLGGIQCTMSGANTFFRSGALTLTTPPGAPNPAEFSIPSFVTSATSKSVEVAVEGRSKVLYCLATARPYPTITWKKNGKVLQDGVDFFKIPSAFHGRLLNITKVDENMHEDIYTCQASNNQTIGTGPQEHNIDLQVEVAPRWIVEPPRLQKISISANANLSCDVYAEPEPQIKWFRDGFELVTSQKVQLNKTVLLFNEITLNETGIYQCVAENKHGMIVSSTYVEVFAMAPSFQKNGFGPFYLFQDSEGRLKCNPEASPRPNVFKWYKDDVEITPGVTYQIESEGTLVISNVNRSRDQGRYSCYAQNFLGTALAESIASVLESTQIILPPKDLDVTEGSRVELHCEAVAKPSLELHYLWKRYDAIIQYNQRVRWIRDRNVLTIANITVEDAGIYTCLAYTPQPERSEDFASATINITGAPYPPFNLTFSSDCKSQNRTLTWVTGKLNNASITHFLIEGKSTDADDFWKVIANVTNPTATSYPLVNMTGFYKMAFRIRAVNRFGPSRPSKPTSSFCPTNATGQGPKPAPPQITEFLQNDLVAPDEVKFRDNVNWQLDLPCRATGSNKLQWEWRHNDSIINQNKFEFDDDWQLSQDGTLKAKSLSISDSGTYQCFVTDTVTGVKTFSRKLRVAVTAVGQFNDELPITRQVLLGRPFEFDCPPHGPSSLVSFTWTSASKKELNIQFPRSERVAIDPSNGALHIVYVTPEDITHIRDLGGIQCTMSGSNTFFSSGALTLTTPPGVPDPAEFSIPSFVTSATSKSVEVAVEGRSKVLYCLATARPYPTITWKKNGKVLQDGVDFFKIPSPFHGRLLNITKVDENMHEDIYTCQASNNQTIGTGPQERNINLQVEVAPRWIVEPPRLQKISISANANLSCDVYAEPEPQIKWFRDGFELVTSQKVQLNKTVLLFNEITLNETGIYQCVAENKHGMIVSSTYVEVFAMAPSFQKNGFGPFYLFQDSEGRLKCNPEASPRPNVFKWYKDDVEITPGVSYQIESEGTLVISNVNRSRDQGRYSCYAQNFLGTALAESIASVLESTQIILPPKDLDVTEGSRVELHCEAVAKPSLELHYLWKRYDAIIQYNQRVRWIRDRNVLTIANITVEDAGIYTCLAYTSQPERSEDFASAKIDITGAPYPPFNLTFSSDCKSQNRTLTWVTGKLNNASITHFLIEGKSTDADDFWKVIANVTNPIATSYPLVNMTGFYKMAFRIRAVNRFGPSRPSKPTSSFCPTNATGQGPKPAPPQITEFLQNDLVAPDEVKFRANVNWQLNLPCRATGSNKLSWEWRHNDGIINPNKFEFDDDWQLSQDGTLKAKGLSISDSGTYQCFVTDTVTGVKTFSRKLRVAVTAVGQFNDYSSITRQVQLGRPFEFDCPPHGPSSLVSFTWTSKKELNIQFPRSERVAIDPSNGALHIMYVTPEDITHIRDLGGIQCTMSGANTFFRSGALTLTTPPGVPDPAIFSIPSFTSATSNSVEVAVEGRSKVLYCLATARPYPTITWKKNGKVLQDGVDFFKIPSAFHGRLLNITKVDENMHEDIYTCQASNNQSIGIGPQERNIYLQVEVAPRWNVEPPRLQKFSLASNANLSCDVYAEPEPQIKWFRDGVELVASSKVRQVNTDLLFSDLTLDEAGIYQCVAENKHGMIVSSTYVEVLAIAPSFQKEGLGPFYLFQESEGRLKCDPEAAPRPTIFKWYKDDDEITTSVTYQIENDGTLVISNVNRSRDEGRYACYAENFLGNATENSRATVFESTQIILPPKDLDVTEGSRVELHCEAVAKLSLELHYLWKRYDAIIQYNQRVRWIQDRNVLTIANITVEDAGIYTCLAYTPEPERSEDFASATIDIAGAPYLPFNLTFSSDCKNQNTTLTWVTGKLNNASITHFLIEGKSTDADDFWKVIANVTNPIATSYPLVNMTGLYKMAFRIRAFNRFGPSRPSKPTSSFCPTSATGASYPPFNLTFSSDCKNRNATLTWVTGKSHNASITHFLIEGKSTDADDFWKVIANVTNPIATSYPLVNMTGLYKMAFRIRAVNRFGPSSPSKPTSSFCPTNATAPDKWPDNFRGIPGKAEQLDVGWTAMRMVEWNGPGLFYKLWYGRVGHGNSLEETVLDDPKTERFNIPNAGYYVQWQFQIQAINDIAAGPKSPLVKAFSGQDPPTGRPEDVTVGTVTARSVELSWKPVTVTRGSVDGYRIYYWEESLVSAKRRRRAIPSFALSTNVMEGSTQKYAVTGLRPYTCYTMAITSYNSGGDGPESAEVKVNTSDPEPGPPSDVKIYAFPKYVLVTWKPPLEPNGIITKYRVGLKTYAGSEPKDVEVEMQETGADARKKLLEMLEPETNYVIEIQAMTAIGWGKGVRKTTKTVPWTSPAKPEKPVIEGTASDAVRVDYKFGLGGGYTHEFLVMFRKKLVGEEFQNTTWINHFLEQSVLIRHLDPVLYEFKTVARSDYPLKANPQESPASVVVEGRPLPGVINAGKRETTPIHQTAWFIALLVLAYLCTL